MLTPEQREEILAMNRRKYPILVRKFECRCCGRVVIGRWKDPGCYVMDDPGWVGIESLCSDCAKPFWRDYEVRCQETGCVPLNQL